MISEIKIKDVEECWKWKIKKEDEIRMKKKGGMKDEKDKNWVRNWVS